MARSEAGDDESVLFVLVTEGALASTMLPGSLLELPPSEQALVDLADVLRHRLGNISAGIEGYADLLVAGLHDPAEIELAMCVSRGAHAINDLILELDGFRTPLTPEPAAVDCVAVMTELTRLLGAGSARLEARYEAFPPFIADRLLIARALEALVRNGLEATGPIGTVRLEVGRVDEGVAFDVRNEGIPPADADRLFAPFFTTKIRHLGVGLPLVRRIALAHGGRAELMHASVERGTCFRLTIPSLPL